MKRLSELWTKVDAVVRSCKTEEQCNNAGNYIDIAYKYALETAGNMTAELGIIAHSWASDIVRLHTVNELNKSKIRLAKRA